MSASRFSNPFNTVNSISESFTNVINTISNIIDWFKDIQIHMTTFITTVVGTIYELISSLILKTPLWLFDNTWFDNMTYLISIVSIGVVTLLTMINGFKRKLQKRHTNLNTIMKRWFIVAGLSTITPTLLYYFYKILNFLSDSIMSASTSYIKNPITPKLPWIDLIILTIFGVIMIGQTIPLLLKNGKRFFNILILGLIAPLAGVAWIFDSHRHLFNQWWENLWQLSLIQIIYAFYLLVIGLFLYGIPTPNDFHGFAIKMLIAIGGFMSLIDPPQFVNRRLWEGDLSNVYKNSKTSVNKVKNNYKMIRKTITSPIRATEYIFNHPKLQKVDSTANTRMSRYHSKRWFKR